VIAFASMDAFLVFMQTRPPAVEEAEKRGAEVAGKLLQREARNMIGAEIDQWPPLAPSTVEEKERLGYTGQVSPTDPLLRTGELRLSITHQIEQHAVVLGSDDPIAPYQEHGTGHIPPRPFIGSTLFRDGHDALDLVANHMAGAMAGRNEPLRPVPRRDGDESPTE
jgi:phage gpG-like protein